MTLLVCFTDRVPKPAERDVRCEFILAHPEDADFALTRFEELYQATWLREIHRRLQLPVAPGTFPQYDPALRVDDVLFIEIRVFAVPGRRRFVGYQYKDPAQRKIFMEKINGRTTETRAGLPAS